MCFDLIVSPPQIIPSEGTTGQIQANGWWSFMDNLLDLDWVHYTSLAMKLSG